MMIKQAILSNKDFHEKYENSLFNKRLVFCAYLLEFGLTLFITIIIVLLTNLISQKGWSIYGIHFTATNIFYLLNILFSPFFIYCVIKFYKSKEKERITGLSIPLLLFLVILLLRLVIDSYSDQASLGYRWLSVVSMIYFPLLFFAFTPSEKYKDYVLMGMTIGMTFVCVIIIPLWFHWIYSGNTGKSSVFLKWNIQHNFHAFLIAQVGIISLNLVSISLWGMFQHRHFKSFIWALLYCLGGIVTIFSASMSFFLGYCVAHFLIFLCPNFFTNKKKLLTIFLIIIIFNYIAFSFIGRNDFIKTNIGRIQRIIDNFYTAKKQDQSIPIPKNSNQITMKDKDTDLFKMCPDNIQEIPSSYEKSLSQTAIQDEGLYTKDTGTDLLSFFSIKSITQRAKKFDKVRYGLWKEAVEQFMTSPIFGSSMRLNNNKNIKSPHNIIIQAYLGTGIIGGTLFLFILICTCFDALFVIRNKPEWGWAGFSYLVFVIVYQFGTALEMSYILWFSMVILRANANDIRKPIDHLKDVQNL
jgi:hypothetical protein